MTLPRAAFVSRGATGAALAALVRSQMLAVRSTALFRGHDAIVDHCLADHCACPLPSVRFTSRIAAFDPQHAAANGVLVATIYSLDDPVDANFAGFFERKIVPALRKAGVDPIAQFRTRKASNDFPGLPLGDDDDAFVWFARFADEAAYRKSAAALAASPNWRDWISVDLRHRLTCDPRTLRLASAPRSVLHA